MTNRIILASFFLLAGALLRAQSGLTMDSSVKYWDEGPLSYSDISTRAGELPLISEFQYGISWSSKDTKIGNTTIRAPYTRTYMNPFSSWVHPDFRTEAMLQYIQAGFDYVEICRRRALNDYRQGSSFRLEDVMDFHMDVADSFLAKMKDDTDQGEDAAAVRDYADRVKEELEHIEEPQYSDLKVYPRGYGIGMHVGVGSEFHTGTLSDYVGPIVGLDFGFDFFFNRVDILFSGVLGGAGHYKLPIQRDGYQWDAGERARGGNMELSLGYVAFDSQWWKIIPFAGIGVGFLDYASNPVNVEKDTDEISGFRYQAGVSTDFKFSRSVDYTTFRDDVGEWSVRTRLYVAHTALPTPAPYWSVNFGLSINMLGWLLK